MRLAVRVLLALRLEAALDHASIRVVVGLTRNEQQVAEADALR